jgi:hypothetical protein
VPPIQPVHVLDPRNDTVLATESVKLVEELVEDDATLAEPDQSQASLVGGSFRLSGDALQQSFQMLQRVVHRGVLRNAAVAARDEILKATERLVLHPAKQSQSQGLGLLVMVVPRGANHYNVRVRKCGAKDQGRAVQAPVRVVLVVPVALHVFVEVLKRRE